MSDHSFIADHMPPTKTAKKVNNEWLNYFLNQKVTKTDFAVFKYFSNLIFVYVSALL